MHCLRKSNGRLLRTHKGYKHDAQNGVLKNMQVAVPSASSPGSPVLSASSKSEYSSSLRADAPSATPRAVHPLNVSEYARRARAKVAAREKTTTPESIATSGLGLGFPDSFSGVSFPSGLQGRKAPDVSASWKDGFWRYLVVSGRC